MSAPLLECDTINLGYCPHEAHCAQLSVKSETVTGAMLSLIQESLRDLFLCPQMSFNFVLYQLRLSRHN